MILAAWHDPASDADRVGWVRGLPPGHRALLQAGRIRHFMADDGRVQDNYLGHYKRLGEIKRAYDLGNLFHLNQNIRPAP